MSITLPDDRVTTYSPVVATTTFGADFPVFDNDDLAVIHNGVERTDFTVLATYVASISNDARVVFATGITGSVLVLGAREPRRSNRFGSGPINANMLNAAFDTVEGEMQEARRDIHRSAKSPVGTDGPDIPSPEEGKILGWTNNKLTNFQTIPQGNLVVGAAGAVALAAATPSDLRTAAGVEYATGPEATAASRTDKVMSPAATKTLIDTTPISSTGTGSTVGATIGVRFGDIPNIIRDFGAPTDGSDCSAAFNTALTQVAALGGKELFIPPGSYTWTGGAISMRKLKIRGAGMDTARINVKKTNSTIFRFDTIIGYPEISDLNISQDASTPATAGAAFHFTEKGVLGPKLMRIKTNDLWQAISCDVGVGHAGAGVNGALIEDCSFDNCKKYGWYLIGAVNWVFKGGYTTMSSFAPNTAACVLDSNCEGILLSQHFALAGEYPFIMQNVQSGGVPAKECLFSQFTFDGGAGASAAAKILAGRRNHFAQCWVSNQHGVGIDWNNPTADPSILLSNSWVGGTFINIGSNAMELNGKVKGLRVMGAHFGSWGLLAPNTYSGVYASANADTSFDISHNFFGNDADVPASAWRGITVNSGTYSRYIISRNMNLGITGTLVNDGGTASVAKDVSNNL